MLLQSSHGLGLLVVRMLVRRPKNERSIANILKGFRGRRGRKGSKGDQGSPGLDGEDAIVPNCDILVI